MANEFGHTLVPIVITKTASSTGTALYSVSRFVYEFVVQKNTSATSVLIGAGTGGVKLTAGSSISFNNVPTESAGPNQFDLSQFTVTAAAASSVVVTVLAIVKKAQANNPPTPN